MSILDILVEWEAGCFFTDALLADAYTSFIERLRSAPRHSGGKGRKNGNKGHFEMLLFGFPVGLNLFRSDPAIKFW